MREILFRAVSKEDNKVIYGDYFRENHLGVEIHALTYYDRLKGGSVFEEIFPETLSQLLYQGESGRHFDGDIYTHKHYEDYKMKVYFDQELLAVMGQVYDDEGYYDKVTLLPSDFENLMEIV